MSSEVKSNKEHLSKIYADFEESTLISPNKSRENEKNIISKSEYEIKKENLVGFINSNSISINGLLLASLTLTLNKFNFSLLADGSGRAGAEGTDEVEEV